MHRVRLIHWNGPEGRECAMRLASLGFQAEFDDLDGQALLRVIRSRLPDAIVIDLARLPSHGREMAVGLRRSKELRAVPLVFVDGAPEKVARIRVMFPDAAYTSWGRLKTVLPRAIAQPPATPVVPPYDGTSGKPAVEKLGIKEGMRVSVLGAPKGAADALAPIPPKVKLTAKPESRADLFLCFVRSSHELSAQLVSLGRVVDRQTVWMIWPKKASGVKSDLDGNLVRETGLRTGWVDFKVCSVDDTWSGLAFKRRRGVRP